MQEKELKHLQQVILSMIKDIDRLCTQNGIEYYLFGGSTLGAVRHKGFIPWDDDMDIVMTPSNYEKFCHLCRTELDTQKYYFQEGLVDWHLNFSKIRLKGTYIEEIEADEGIEKTNQGISVDIFKIDNACNSKLGQYWQYFCAKVWLAYLISRRTYESASGMKKIMMLFSQILSIQAIESFFRFQVEKYNKRMTNFYADFMGRTRFSKPPYSIMKKEVYGTPIRVPFEDTELPVQEKAEEYLSLTFGNYLQLPPEDKRKPWHIIKVNFGKYE
jgi:lipopolysaccharide cholinephosphotransferase